MLNMTPAAKIALGIALPTAAVLIYWLITEVWKTDEDPEEYKASNVRTSKQTIIEVKVPKEYVGSVIGRGGCNIKDMAEKTGARIDFAPKQDERGNEADFRICRIRGSQESAQKAELLVHQTIAQSEKHTICITVRVRCLGRIIGRNGDSIRGMQRSSGAKIIIDTQGDESNPNNEKAITIIGTVQQIEMAKGLIEEKVKEDDAFRAKVSLASANREARKKNEATGGIDQDVRPADKGDNSVTSGIVRADLVINERWDSYSQEKPKKSFTEVYVSAVVDPSNFWVQIINTRCMQFDELVGQMTTHYSSLVENNDTTYIPTSYKVGEMVAAPFSHDDSWYRAKIDKTDDENDDVTLFYVDYGDTGIVAKSQIRTLDHNYLGLPFQAIKCCLAQITPIADQWTDRAIDDFENLTHCANWVVVMAQTVGYRSGEIDPIPCLQLVDTSKGLDIDVNQEMIARGHAKKDDSNHSNGNHSNLAALLTSPSVKPLMNGDIEKPKENGAIEENDEKVDNLVENCLGDAVSAICAERTSEVNKTCDNTHGDVIDLCETTTK